MTSSTDAVFWVIFKPIIEISSWNLACQVLWYVYNIYSVFWIFWKFWILSKVFLKIMLWVLWVKNLFFKSEMPFCKALYFTLFGFFRLHFAWFPNFGDFFNIYCSSAKNGMALGHQNRYNSKRFWQDHSGCGMNA